MTIEVYQDQYRVFQILSASAKALDFQTLVYKTGLEQAMVMGTISYAVNDGFIEMTESVREELVLDDHIGELIAKGLPERQFLSCLVAGPLSMQDSAQKANELGIKINEVIKWGVLRGWIEKKSEKKEAKKESLLAITPAGTQALTNKDDDEKAIQMSLDSAQQFQFQQDIKQGRRFTPNFFLDELTGLGLNAERIKLLLKSRPELAKIKDRTMRWVGLTEKGRSVISQMHVKQEEKNILTSEDITSGAWKQISLRPYNIALSAQTIATKKCHPLQKIIQEARRAFLQMGFEEMVSSHVETSFWDFDALFQPQDHPSRDMQDTFYLKNPAQGDLPDSSIVESVRQTHQNGGNTGSTGWGYHWEENEARKMVMRTHTTATSIRTIAKNPNPPHKFFCVGRVFRNETINFKHLPEFHQVDGIIVDKDASFSCLLGTLKEFYLVMGFPKIKFKPAFFPYTEPSAEIYVWMESRKQWIELGGSGIFRPEVTRPFGCQVPVMAWGLGLERLAMLRYGLSDIRVLYGSDLDWLSEVRLCQ